MNGKNGRFWKITEFITLGSKGERRGDPSRLIGWLAPCVCNCCQLQHASSWACLACCYSPLLSQSGPVLLTLAMAVVHCEWRFVLRLPEHPLLCCLLSDLKVILLSWIAFVPCASFCGNWTSLSVLPSVWSEGNSPQLNCFCTLCIILWELDVTFSVAFCLIWR